LCTNAGSATAADYSILSAGVETPRDLDVGRAGYDIHTMSSDRSHAFVTSRLGVKSQTVLPKEVRTALGVGPGDQIGYSIQGGRVILTAVRAPQPEEDPFACFDEWASEADSEGYASL
jgi:antitoxin PrlF